MAKKQARVAEAAVSKAENTKEQMEKKLCQVEHGIKLEQKKTKKEALSEYRSDIRRMQKKQFDLITSIGNLHSRLTHADLTFAVDTC